MRKVPSDMMSTPTNREEAIGLAEGWGQLADNETEDDVERHRPREDAARFWALAECLPAAEPTLEDRVNANPEALGDAIKNLRKPRG